MSNVRPLFDLKAPVYQQGPQREPPHNVRAERAVIAALLLRNEGFDQVATILIPDHFYDPILGRLYAEIARCVVSGKKADAVLLNGWFRQQKDVHLLPVRPEAYLAELVTHSFIGHQLTTYAEQIRDLYIRRIVIERTTGATEAAYDLSIPISDLTTHVASAIDAASFAEAGQGSRSFNEVMDEALALATTPVEGGGNSWIRIRGFPRFSYLMSFQPGDMTLLGGRQGEGKSALAFGWALDAARELSETGLPVQTTGGIVCVSLDMPDHQIANRALGALARVDISDISNRRLTEHQVEALKAARVTLDSLPLEFISGAGLTPTKIEMRLRQARRKFGGHIRMIVIDHFHKIEWEQGWARNGETFAYNRIANLIHNWCKPAGFNCHLLVLVQLNMKDMARRQEKAPTRADIRFSTDLVSNADNVLFVYQPVMDLPQTPPQRRENEFQQDYIDRLRDLEVRRQQLQGKAMLILDKLRYAGTDQGSIPLIFEGKATRLSEDPRQQPEAPYAIED